MRWLVFAIALMIPGCLDDDTVPVDSALDEPVDVAYAELSAQTGWMTVAGPWNSWLETEVPPGSREVHIELDFDPYSGLYDIIAYGPDGEESRCGDPCVTGLHGGSLKLILDAGQPGAWRFEFMGNGAGLVQGSYWFDAPIS